MTMTGIILSSLLATQVWAHNRDKTQAEGQQEQEYQQGEALEQQSEPRQQAAPTAQQQQEGAPELQTITGKVAKTKAVQLRGTDVQHQVALVRTAQNVLLVADLGPSDDPSTQPVREGQQVTLVGQTGRVGDRAVLLTSTIKAGNRTIQVERTEEVAAQKRQMDMKKTSELTGTIRRQKDVGIRGTDQRHQVILLESQDGYQVAVDLGPGDALPEMEVGQEITVTGHPVQIGERLVFWAEEFRQGETETAIKRQMAGAEPKKMDKTKGKMKETEQQQPPPPQEQQQEQQQLPEGQ